MRGNERRMRGEDEWREEEIKDRSIRPVRLDTRAIRMKYCNVRCRGSSGKVDEIDDSRKDK